MKEIKLRTIGIVLLLILIIHIIAIGAGLYEGEVIWIDKILHVLAGIGLGAAGLWLLQKRYSQEVLETMPISMVGMSLLFFIVLGGIVWELFEFFAWQIFPQYAFTFKFYSPVISDLLGDLVADVLGGLLFVWYTLRR